MRPVHKKEGERQRKEGKLIREEVREVREGVSYCNKHPRPSDLNNWFPIVLEAEDKGLRCWHS